MPSRSMVANASSMMPQLGSELLKGIIGGNGNASKRPINRNASALVHRIALIEKMFA